MFLEVAQKQNPKFLVTLTQKLNISCKNGRMPKCFPVDISATFFCEGKVLYLEESFNQEGTNVIYNDLQKKLHVKTNCLPRIIKTKSNFWSQMVEYSFNVIYQRPLSMQDVVIIQLFTSCIELSSAMLASSLPFVVCGTCNLCASYFVYCFLP